MGRVGEGLGAILGIAFTVLVLSASTGVVREYCLDTNATEASGSVVVDKHWTYILWPPGPFASIDPAGRCVRNSPLREALSAIGIWRLPSPSAQVRQHIASQLKGSRASVQPASGSTVSSRQMDNEQRDAGYVRAISQVMAPFTRPPANPTDYAAGTRRLQYAIARLARLTPPPAFVKSQNSLMAGLRNQAALGQRLARASAAHDAVALSNLEQKTVAAEQVVRLATREMVNAYNSCLAGGWKNC